MKYITLFLLFFSFFISTQAYSETSFFEITSENKSTQSPKFKIHNTLSDAVVQVRGEYITSKSEQLYFTLLDGVEYQAVRLGSEQYSPDWVTWSGKLQPRDTKLFSEKNTPGYAFISHYKGRVSAVFHTDLGDHYLITPGENGEHLLTHVDGKTACPLDKVQDAGLLTDHHELFAEPDDKMLVDRIGRGVTQIDVAMLYTRHFLSSISDQQMAESFMTTALGMANDVFKMSGINTRYRVVYLGPNPDTNLVLPLKPNDESVFNNKIANVALDWLNQKPSLIQQLQQGYGADMVALFVPLVEDTNSDFCGIANLPISRNSVTEVFRRSPPVGNNFDQIFTDQAYIGLEMNCGQSDFTFAHEHGHNLALNHDEDTDPSPDRLEPFYLGYLFTANGNEMSTMMGCSIDPNGTVPGGKCNRVARISNPDSSITYEGVAVGDADHNNAAAVISRSVRYAGFRPVVNNNATPTITITSPTEGTMVAGGVPITFQATANDSEDGNLTAAIQWHVDVEPISGSGSPFTTALFLDGAHVITASVTDSGGKRVETSIRVTVQSGLPDIEVRRVPGEQVILNGNSFSFPDTSVDNLPISRLFRICNTGMGGLLIDNPAQLVSGNGFTQIGAIPDNLIEPQACSNFRVRFHVNNPEDYNGQIQIQSNDPDEGTYTIPVSATATASAVQLVASYVPGFGENRVSFHSSSNNPTQFSFFYDPNLGTFEERVGGACSIGADNPTYLRLSLAGSILNQGGIDACSFQASWDNQMFQCSAQVVSLLNSGQDIVINTSTYLTDLNTCEDKFPLEPHVLVAVNHWFKVEFVANNVAYPRQVKFRQKAELKNFYSEADTDVNQANPDGNFGSSTQLQVRGGAGGQTRYAFTRYRVVPPAFSPAVSARLHWRVLGNPISHTDLHDVCSANWSETGMTWNNWTDPSQAQGSCGIIDTAINLPANRTVRFNLDSELFNFDFLVNTLSYGGASTDTRAGRRFASRESAGQNRPVLKVTYQRNLN